MKLIIQRIKEEYILLTQFGPIQRAWLRFLRDNPDKQLRTKLGYRNSSTGDNYKACCLGQFGLMVGICKWNDYTLLSLHGSVNFPDESDMIKYGFRDVNARHENFEKYPNLVNINDSRTWLDVYYACINDPKGYFTKKV
jgi:hypothetical protein